MFDAPPPDFRPLYEQPPRLLLMGFRPYVPREYVPLVRRPDKPCSLGCGNTMSASAQGTVCATCYSARYRKARAEGAKQGGRAKLVVQIGEVFGRLTAIADGGLDAHKGRIVVLRCACGREVRRRLTSMRMMSGQKRNSSCRSCRP